MVRRSLSLAAALLAAFHLWLFVNQAFAGALVDPALIARWLIAGGLTLALVNLRRRGLSLVRGRHATAVWLIAALLHGPALSQNVDAVSPTVPQVVATLAEAIGGLAVAGTLLLLLAIRLRRATAAPQPVLTLEAPAFLGALALHSFLCLTPRPPPL
jgi:hypothetical protein